MTTVIPNPIPAQPAEAGYCTSTLTQQQTILPGASSLPSWSHLVAQVDDCPDTLQDTESHQTHLMKVIKSLIQPQPWPQTLDLHLLLAKIEATPLFQTPPLKVYNLSSTTKEPH